MSPAGIATVDIFATTPCPFSLAYLNQCIFETAIHFSARNHRVVQAQDIHEYCRQHQQQGQPNPPILVKLSTVRMFMTVVGHPFSLLIVQNAQSVLNARFNRRIKG
jgi:hypothetical protein